MIGNDTIFALATGMGRAGVAIIRISGPEAHTVLLSLSQKPLPLARVAVVRKLRSKTGEKLDEALVLKFSGPASFTGEDMVELHVHGGEAVIDGVSHALFSFGLRQAEPGEFTKRAFENGRMDLTEAEGLADLIDAKSEVQKRQALLQMSGGLKDRYEGWREQIIVLLARIEGELDFPDEGDVPSDLSTSAVLGMQSLEEDLSAALADRHKGERVRHGLEITVIGAPNTGKSSIINKLGRKNAAIVSPEAGTTRDIIEVHLELGGLPVRLSDTAGLRDTSNLIEKEGVRRALERAKISDLNIGVVDVTDEGQLRRMASLLGDNDILVLNKIDQVNSSEAVRLLDVSRETPIGGDIILTSTVSGEGLDELEASLTEKILALFSVGETSCLTRARHRECVERALRSVKSAQSKLAVSPEVAGAELVGALHALKELAGETDIEAVLDKVFSSFCIGK